MDSPFSLTTASTSTLILDPAHSPGKLAETGNSNPDSQTHTTGRDPNHNHLNLKIQLPGVPSSRPALQVQTAAAPLTTARMSGRGFVEPHHSHLPRRPRTAARIELRATFRAGGRYGVGSESSAEGEEHGRDGVKRGQRGERDIGKPGVAQLIPENVRGTLEGSEFPDPAEGEGEDQVIVGSAEVGTEVPEGEGEGGGGDVEPCTTDFDSNLTEDGFNPQDENDASAARGGSALIARRRASRSYALQRMLDSQGVSEPHAENGMSGITPAVPSTSQVDFLATSFSQTPQRFPELLTQQRLPDLLPTTKQTLQPLVGNLPRRHTRRVSRSRGFGQGGRYGRSDGRERRGFSVDVERRSVSTSNTNWRRGFSVDVERRPALAIAEQEQEWGDDSGVGIRAQRSQTRTRRVSMPRRMDVGGYPHPRFDCRRRKRKEGAGRLAEEMKLQWVGIAGGMGVGVDVWVGVDPWAGHRRRLERDCERWSAVERAMSCLMQARGDVRSSGSRRIKRVVRIVSGGRPRWDEESSSEEDGGEEEGEESGYHNPAIWARQRCVDGADRSVSKARRVEDELDILTVQVRAGGGKARHVEVEVDGPDGGSEDRGCTRLSVEQMKEGCVFMRGVGWLDAGRGVCRGDDEKGDDQSDGQCKDEQDEADPVVLILASDEDRMVDALSMALCFLVVSDLEREEEFGRVRGGVGKQEVGDVVNQEEVGDRMRQGVEVVKQGDLEGGLREGDMKSASGDAVRQKSGEMVQEEEVKDGETQREMVILDFVSDGLVGGNRELITEDDTLDEPKTVDIPAPPSEAVPIHFQETSQDNQNLDEEETSTRDGTPDGLSFEAPSECLKEVEVDVERREEVNAAVDACNPLNLDGPACVDSTSEGIVAPEKGQENALQEQEQENTLSEKQSGNLVNEMEPETALNEKELESTLHEDAREKALTEGEQQVEEEYTPVHRLLWRMHDEYYLNNAVVSIEPSNGHPGNKDEDVEVEIDLDLEVSNHKFPISVPNGTSTKRIGSTAPPIPGSSSRPNLPGSSQNQIQGSTPRPEIHTASSSSSNDYPHPQFHPDRDPHDDPESGSNALLNPRLPKASGGARRFEASTRANGTVGGRWELSLGEEWRGLIGFEGAWKVWEGVRRVRSG